MTVVAQHVVHDGGDLRFQFVDKLGGIVFLVFDVAQFLLPDARQLAARQQFLLDDVNVTEPASLPQMTSTLLTL